MGQAMSITTNLGTPLERREVFPTDIPGLLKLTEAVGWTFTAQDFETAFAGGQIYGHFSGNRLVSSAAVFPIGADHASIGAVMVHPDFRRRGLGRELMVQIHTHPSYQDRVFRLISTDEGAPLYDVLGYRCVTRAHKWIRPTPWDQGPLGGPGHAGFEGRDMALGDLPCLGAVERPSVGGGPARLGLGR